MKRMRVLILRTAAVLLLIPAIGMLTGGARTAFDYVFAAACVGGAVAFFIYAHKIG